MNRQSIIALATLVVVLGYTGDSQAVTMEWAFVGVKGGGLSDFTGYGSMGYDYYIGKYEVTNSQYGELLNGVAATDTYGLYNVDMGSSYGGINRSGSPGSYTYSVKDGWENKPVNYVSWYDTIRFANWMHNGQGNSSTEVGAYTITEAGIENNSIARNSTARVFLPYHDEWYKAAYHKGSGTQGYWRYATQSDTTPTAEAPPGGSNSANHDFAVGSLTDVGAYTFSVSAYGTFDQSGNIFEWVEGFHFGSPFYRPLRGDSWVHGLSGAGGFGLEFPDREYAWYGFRIATTIPEPATVLLLGFGGLVLLRKRRR